MALLEPITPQITTARLKLQDTITTEFTAEGWVAQGDILHKSVGRDGKTRIAVSPANEIPVSNIRLTMQFNLFVQFYGPWKDTIDPLQIVDPAKIEWYAERFKRVLRTNDPDQDSVWFFSLTDIQYPHDPTGNATRFEARVTAYGNNSSLMETVG